MDAPASQPLATLLVVDDSPDSLLGISGILRDSYRVKVANGGEKALELARGATPPDLILLDVRMPDLDGFEVCARLKADPATCEIPVLFITAAEEIEDEAEGFRRGCVDYIHKPISPPLLLARVRTHLEQHRLRMAERELVERTLKGSLALMVELLALGDPETYGWAKAHADLCETLARELGVEDPWNVGLAAVLSQVGMLTLPDALVAKVRNRLPLNSEERELYGRVPELGHRLLKEIPRLEEVAEAIRGSQAHFEDTAAEALPLASRILKVSYDFMRRRARNESVRVILREMLARTDAYDPAVLRVLKGLAEAGAFEETPTGGEAGREVDLDLVQPGQVLAYGVEDPEGNPLLRPGAVLSASHLMRLQNLARIGRLPRTVWIRG